MNKTTKGTRKLQLNRETLRSLERGELLAARVGGGITVVSNCLTRCPSETCSRHATCTC